LDIARILAELKRQRRRLDEAITALEDVALRTQKQARPKNRQPKKAAKHRRQARTTPRSPHAESIPNLGKLIPFRSSRRRARPKPSRAEEA
jgi:hypothetical protein